MEKNQNYDVVIIFAYGEGQRMNKQLIGEMAKLDPFPKQMFMQETIGDLIWKDGPFDERTDFIASQKSDHISSLAIVAQFAAIAARRGWKKVFVIAARQHYWRCERDLKKVGFKVSGIRGEVGYDKTDSQFWVRNPFVWWVRETMLRLLPFALYKKISLRAT